MKSPKIRFAAAELTRAEFLQLWGHVYRQVIATDAERYPELHAGLIKLLFGFERHAHSVFTDQEVSRFLLLFEHNAHPDTLKAIRTDSGPVHAAAR